MPQVPQSWLLVLEALESSMSPWMTPTAVAGRLGLDVEETTDMLATLDAAGLVSVLEPEDGDGPLVALSVRGQESLSRAMAGSVSASASV